MQGQHPESRACRGPVISARVPPSILLFATDPRTAMLDGYGPLRFNVGLVLSGLLQLIQLELHATSGDSVTVQTKYGTLRGSPSPLDSRVSQFLGIPFAAPPVGDRRWKPPQPVNPWVGTRDALSFGYSCVQTKSNDYFYTESLFGYFYGNQSEDCLTLNVWTSSNCIMADKNCSLPVLVWIYGGSFIIGGTKKRCMTVLFSPRKERLWSH